MSAATDLRSYAAHSDGTNPQRCARSPIAPDGQERATRPPGRDISHGARTPLVSIVIPCFNQARYLSEAIESALGQTHRPIEIVVVDDGSPDNVRDVVRRYPDVQYIRQDNAGLAAARNRGLAASRGGYLVFLDADDRLLPAAVATSLNWLRRYPAWAFVAGHFRYIDRAGSVLEEREARPVGPNHYLELLRTNYIEMHATVLYRRGVLEAVGGFDPSLRACEDYALFLRITRRHAIGCHPIVIAEYRQHDLNMTRDSSLMLRTAVHVLAAEWGYVRADSRRVAAYRSGMRFWRQYYGRRLAVDVRHDLRRRCWRRALRGLLTLLGHYPIGLAAILPVRETVQTVLSAAGSVVVGRWRRGSRRLRMRSLRRLTAADPSAQTAPEP